MKNYNLKSTCIPITCLPEGTRLIPAASIFKDNSEGWVVLPPDKSLKNKEAFDEWRDEMFNNAINLGLKQSPQ